MYALWRKTTWAACDAAIARKKKKKKNVDCDSATPFFFFFFRWPLSEGQIWVTRASASVSRLMNIIEFNGNYFRSFRFFLSLSLSLILSEKWPCDAFSLISVFIFYLIFIGFVNLRVFREFISFGIIIKNIIIRWFVRKISIFN